MFNNTFSVKDFKVTKAQLLIWANRFSSCAFLDTNQYPSCWDINECVLAAGSIASLKAKVGHALDLLQQFIDQHKGQWIFGHLNYDLKDEIEPAPATLPGAVGFDVVHFFVPETIIRLSPGTVSIASHFVDPAIIWEEVCHCNTALSNNRSVIPVLAPSQSKSAYIETIQRLKEHIHRGDCYEINFCQEFFAANTIIDPVGMYLELTGLSPNPFSCFYKVGESYLMCASPERYLMRKGNRLFSQPIKGTAARNLEDSEDDLIRSAKLLRDPKERSENVMIVDLVRNDLSRICSEGSVKVDELFGIYTYPHVHQMISTVSGELKAGTSFSDIIRATFPMGSMTGAPKKRVMELIAAYETGNRGIFSGAVGYISPGGDFDFNVVIRSLMYNRVNKYLSYWVGGGITWYSKPGEEYEECMLKAAAIKKVLHHHAAPFL